MALGGTDLNLLVALKALLEEGNVTRAGKRLEMSQPAMSGALARLRRQFDDELLVRNGREYELTPFAVELLPEVQESLRLISQALQVDEAFDPATSDRAFRITLSDYALAVIHRHLNRRIRGRAPHVRLEVTHLGPDVRGSERVLIDHDVLVGPQGYGFPGTSKHLFRDRMVGLLDVNHPLAQHDSLTLDDLRSVSYAQSTFGRGNLTPVDRAFGEHDIERDIHIQVEGWLPLPFLIEGTQLLAVVPSRLARMHTDVAAPKLVQRELPFEPVNLVEAYWYTPGREADAAHRWFFDRLDEVAQDLAE
ncbi:LysR family transcriptional regulator [Actinomycetota bacterium]